MIKDEQFRSIDGQAAFIYYQLWMLAYRRGKPKSKSFLHSSYFNSFYRFAQHVQQVQIPDVKLFISMMKDKNISPSLWTYDQVYNQYLERLDRKLTPIKQAEITINTLFELSDELNVDVSDIFTAISPNTLIQMIRQRKISPWILLHSNKFRKFFVNDTNTEQRVIMESVIRPDYWKMKFKDNPDDVSTIKLYVEELNI